MLTLKMSLDTMFTEGSFRGKTLKEAIDKSALTINNMKNLGLIKLDINALAYLINKRSDIECRLNRVVDKEE